MSTIDLIYFNAGGGHRAAATALESVMRQQRRPWQVRRINVIEVLDPQERFRQFTGMAPEDLYNFRLAKGWTAGLAQELKVFQAALQLGHSVIVRRLKRHWLRTRPDMVVSLIPNFNRSLYDSLAAALPGVPYVTVLTDMADYPPNFWIEPGQAQHVVCGTPKAAAQAAAMGYETQRIHLTSGMIVRPDFYLSSKLERRSERLRLGLDPDRPAGLVLFGGHGSMAMLDIARQLDDVPLILMCGHNSALAQKLRTQTATAGRAVVEFTPDVRRYMQLADFFIGKPGPGSLSEAVQQGLPIVTTRNTWTMPQERYNTDWVSENKLGVVARSMRNIRPAVLEVIARLDELKANVDRIDNRAVFEVPDILAGILENSGTAAAPLIAMPLSA